MDVKRIIPNISSTKMEESKVFYVEFLGLKIVMDMNWVVTFASPSNPSSQLNVVVSDKSFTPNDLVTITIEVTEIDILYEKAIQSGYEISYPLTKEPWGPVRRFWVKDPNGITINIMEQVLSL